MKKATKFFICLSLVILLIFFATKFFGEQLNNYGLANNSIICKLIGGSTFVRSSMDGSTKTCKMEYKDVGKNCVDNADCEGYCLVENGKILKEKFSEFYKQEIHIWQGGKISINEFEKKTGIEVKKGYCAGIKNTICNEPDVVVENNAIRIGAQGFDVFCGGYFE